MMALCRHPNSKIRHGVYGDTLVPYCEACWEKRAQYVEGLRWDTARAEDGLPLNPPEPRDWEPLEIEEEEVPW